MYSHLNQAVAVERIIDDLERSERYRAEHADSDGQSDWPSEAPTTRRTARVRWLGGHKVHTSHRPARA